MKQLLCPVCKVSADDTRLVSKDGKPYKRQYLHKKRIVLCSDRLNGEDNFQEES